MTTPTTAGAERAVERQIEIAAPVSAVWKALTDAEELIRWFPLEARIMPGPGGSVWMRWDDADTVEDRIEVWDPERRLRHVGTAGPWSRIATDYYLEGNGGITVLRVVSSGFGAEDDPDETMKGFGFGWDFELRGLRHYLEHHRGGRRVVAWARARHTMGYERAWSRLAGPGGFFSVAGSTPSEPDSAVTITTVTGDRLEGSVLLAQAPYQFAATIPAWNDAVFRAHLYGGSAMIWLSTYGVAIDRVQDLERRWQHAIEGVFPAQGRRSM